MATNPYVKSLLWLVSLGGLGYVLLKVTTPSEKTIQEIRDNSPRAYITESEKKKLLFMKKLKAATEETPIYLQKKEK